MPPWLLSDDYVIFFFLMIRRPPSSTPFPYTPLSRSLIDGKPATVDAAVEAAADFLHEAHMPLVYGMRSEEHTSELQSHLNLVCRLLLEKKKKRSNRRKLTPPTHNLPALCSVTLRRNA